MKLKYIITLVAVSFLSLGMVTGCATPDAGETDVCDPKAHKPLPILPIVYTIGSCEHRFF